MGRRVTEPFLTFTYVCQAEAPQGNADVLDVKGPANCAARLFVDSEMHLPIMVSWQGAPAGGRGAPPTFDRFRINSRIDAKKFEGRQS